LRRRRGKPSPTRPISTRDPNRTFSYDYESKGAVRRNLTRLIELAELRMAMRLAGKKEGITSK
jgi:hypothetical protein